MSGKFGFVNILGALRYLVMHPCLIKKFFGYITPNDIMVGEDDIKARAIRKLFSVCYDWVQAGRYQDLDVASFTGQLRMLESSEINDEAKSLWGRSGTDPRVIDAAQSKGNIMLLADYAKTIAIRKWWPEFNDLYITGKIDAAVVKTRSLIPILESITVKEHEYFDFSDADKFFRELNSLKLNNLTFGIKELDNDVGWYEPATLNLFVSATGNGKSMMAFYLTIQAINQGKVVNLSCVEDRKQTAITRLYAAATGIEINRLKYHHDKFTEEEKAKMAYWTAKFSTHLHISFVYGESVEVIHRMKEEKDIEATGKGLGKAEVDIVDYTGHIAGRSTGDQRYEKVQASYAARKDYALKTGKMCFDFMQVNRAGVSTMTSGGYLTETDVAGSFDAMQVCDSIISINRSPDNVRDNEAVLYITKGREGGKGQAFTVGTRFERGTYDMSAATRAANKEDTGRP